MNARKILTLTAAAVMAGTSWSAPAGAEPVDTFTPFGSETATVDYTATAGHVGVVLDARHAEGPQQYSLVVNLCLPESDGGCYGRQDLPDWGQTPIVVRSILLFPGAQGRLDVSWCAPAGQLAQVDLLGNNQPPVSPGGVPVHARVSEHVSTGEYMVARTVAGSVCAPPSTTTSTPPTTTATPPTTTTPPTTAATPAPLLPDTPVEIGSPFTTTPPTATPTPAPMLPVTGRASTPMALTGAAAVAAGIVCVAVSRRRLAR